MHVGYTVFCDCSGSLLKTKAAGSFWGSLPMGLQWAPSEEEFLTLSGYIRFM